MNRPLCLHPWLSGVELLAWMHDTKTRSDPPRRLTVWLAHVEPRPAHRIARALGVSIASVWRWVSQYNLQGPSGLGRAGRGGRLSRSAPASG